MTASTDPPVAPAPEMETEGLIAYDLPLQAAVETMGSPEHHASIPKVPYSKAHPCEVAGCNISQEEHHRLAYGIIAENREMRRIIQNAGL